MGGPAFLNIGIPEILLLGPIVGAVVVVYMLSGRGRKDE
jgi:hypothetical protein